MWLWRSLTRNEICVEAVLPVLADFAELSTPSYTILTRTISHALTLSHDQPSTALSSALFLASSSRRHAAVPSQRLLFLAD